MIVDGSNAQEPVNLYFNGDDLFAPFRRRRGLPIGNLTSQFFANLYLDGFDHFVTEVLRAPYVRYVDDFALFHDDPAILAEWWLRIELYLAGRRLKLHPRKTMICRAASQRGSSASFSVMTGIAACLRTTCGVSAIVCAACATTGGQEQSGLAIQGARESLDRSRRTCRYVAPAPRDLPGRPVRSGRCS